MPFVRSISGLRATLGDSLTPECVVKYCSALAAYLPAGKIIIGRDGRPSGDWIELVARGTLNACGRDVEILGMVPTPTVQLMVEKSDAVAGIAITASHNPSQWNGLKFINSHGVFFDAQENKALWDFADNPAHPWKTEPGITKFVESPIEAHIQSILDTKIIRDNNTIEIISKRKLKAVVDAVNASGSFAVPSLLRKFGVEVVELYCSGDGIFPHTPEPLPENLTALAEAVKHHKADIGIAVDPDADRLVLIDENGNPIGEEMTISCACHAAFEYSSEANKCAVVNLSTTATVDAIAKKYNAKVERSAVGEINVVKKMKDCGAIIGGEGSGGVILPESHYGRDCMVGISLIMLLMGKTGKKLSEIVGEYTRYEMIKTKFPFEGSLDSAIESLKTKFADARITVEDGIRIDFPDAWVQLRASNTEPIVRIIAEAADKQSALDLIEKAKEGM